MHVSNTQHPAYTLDLWKVLTDNISAIRKANELEGIKLNGFDLCMIKRQLFHMTFVEQKEDAFLETIEYSDSEYLNEYSGFSKCFADFHNSGLAESVNMTFKEFIKYPNWFADWLLDNWSHFVRSKDKNIIDDTLENEMRKVEQQAKKQAAKDPFRSY